MNKELRHGYRVSIAMADSEEELLEISKQIEADPNLTHMERNLLWSLCATRGKDGQLRASSPGTAGARIGETSPSIPADPGGLHPLSLSIPDRGSAGEFSLDDAKTLWDRFQSFKMAVIERGDFDLINGKKDLNRNGWSKVATAFDISLEIIEREVISAEGKTRISFRVRASKGSRSTENVGSCELEEIEDRAGRFHFMETKAYTRAMKRAIADLVGGAEVE